MDGGPDQPEKTAPQGVVVPSCAVTVRGRMGSSRRLGRLLTLVVLVVCGFLEGCKILEAPTFLDGLRTVVGITTPDVSDSEAAAKPPEKSSAASDPNAIATKTTEPAGSKESTQLTITLPGSKAGQSAVVDDGSASPLILHYRQKFALDAWQKAYDATPVIQQSWQLISRNSATDLPVHANLPRNAQLQSGQIHSSHRWPSYFRYIVRDKDSAASAATGKPARTHTADVTWLAMRQSADGKAQLQPAVSELPSSTTTPATESSETPVEDQATNQRSDPARLSTSELRASLEALKTMLAARELAGVNAAILLSNCEPQRAAELIAPLGEIVVDGRIRLKGEPVTMSPRLRAAAAEAWCRLLLEKPGEPELRLLPAGELLKQDSLAGEVKVVVWQLLAQRIPPDRLPGLADAINEQQGDLPLRQGAYEACLIFATMQKLEQGLLPQHEMLSVQAAHESDPQLSDWPEGMSLARFDRDPMIRRLYGRWLALLNHDQACAIALAQGQDADLRVADDAILNLGLLTAAEAQQALEKFVRSANENQQTLAAMAISLRQPERLAEFLNPPAGQTSTPRFRAAVVSQFGRYPSLTNATLLRPSIRDRSLDVQLALAKLLADWPMELASPLLLEILTEGSGPAREEAMRSISAHLGYSPVFPIHGPREERIVAVKELSRVQGLPATWLNTANSQAYDSTSRADSQSAANSVSQMVNSVPASRNEWSVGELQNELSTIVKLPQGSSERLDRTEFLARSLPVSLPVLTDAAMRLPPEQLTEIAREVFAPADEALKLVLDMNANDVLARRQSASALRQLAASQNPGRIAVKLLQEKLRTEQDQQVWQEVMRAIDRESTPEAAALAQMAIHHHWPDIRLCGCQYVLKHPAIERGLWLAPVIEDPHRPVRLAAIEAAGVCGNPQLIEGLPVNDGSRVGALRPLLQSTDHELMETALVALVRLRDDQAMAELLRRSRHDNPRARLQAVELIRQTGQPRFVEPLIEQLWTEKTDSVIVEILRTLEELVPPHDQPVFDTRLGYPTRQMKIDAWAKWLADQKIRRSE